MPTDSPADAVLEGGAFHRSMLLTVLVLFLGEKTRLSPTLIEPDSTRPAKMRRSSKRYTPWQGMRSGRLCGRYDRLNSSTVSRHVVQDQRGMVSPSAAMAYPW